MIESQSTFRGSNLRLDSPRKLGPIASGFRPASINQTAAIPRALRKYNVQATHGQTANNFTCKAA